jgi:hypothetical protein
MDLSYEKTVSLLQTHNTVVIAIYMIRKRGNTYQCKFLECMATGLGQPFFISIPDKFNLSALLGSAPTEMFIAPVGTEIGSRQLEYLTKIRGTLDSDLVSVSSSFVCHLTKSASRCYRIVGEFDDPYDEAKPSNQIQSLVQKVATLVEEKEEVPAEAAFLSEAPVFSGADEYDPLMVRPAAFIFDEIELGLVYISIELHTFYENASDIGKILGKKYAFLEDNELDVRQEKIDRLTLLFQQMADRFKEVDDILLKRDSASKQKLDTLSKLLKRLYRVENSSEKDIPAINDLKFQIQTTITEEHINSLRLKDSAHDTLELCDILSSQILDKIKGLKDEVQEIGAGDGASLE